MLRYVRNGIGLDLLSLQAMLLRLNEQGIIEAFIGIDLNRGL